MTLVGHRTDPLLAWTNQSVVVYNMMKGILIERKERKKEKKEETTGRQVHKQCGEKCKRVNFIRLNTF